MSVTLLLEFALFRLYKLRYLVWDETNISFNGEDIIMCYEALVMCLFSGYCGSGSHKQFSFMISHILACELSYYNIEPFGFH